MSPVQRRVLAVDDEPEVRAAYRALFRAQDDFELVGVARDGAEAVEAYGDLSPDAVLMDLQMPVVSGIDATREICR